MFRYLIDALGRVFEHPMLVSLFILAGVFLIGGFVLQQVTDNVIAVGFMGVYAVMSAGLGVLGYAILLFYRAVSVIRDRRAAHA